MPRKLFAAILERIGRLRLAYASGKGPPHPTTPSEVRPTGAFFTMVEDKNRVLQIRGPAERLRGVVKAGKSLQVVLRGGTLV